MIMRIQSSLSLGYLLGFIAFFAPILGFIAPKGLSPLVIIGSILGILILWFRRQRIEWLNFPVFLILLCFCIWALLTSIWSIDVISSSIGSARLLGNFVAGGLLFTIIKNITEDEKVLVLRFFFTGFMIVMCILALELLFAGPIFFAIKGLDIEQTGGGEVFWLNHAVVVLSLFVWPIALGLYKKLTLFKINKHPVFFIVCGFFVILILSIVISFSSGTLALFFGILGAILILIFGRRVAIAAALITAIVSFLLPFGFSVLQNPISQINSLISLPSSAEHRIAIWKFTSDKVVKNPIIGWGMNASKNIPGGQSFIFSEDGKQYGRALPLHPHNTILQIWLELGLPGIVLYVGLCIFIMMTSVNRRRLKFESAMIFGQFVTILSISNLSFGMWQAWWISAIWLSAGFMMLIVKMGRKIYS